MGLSLGMKIDEQGNPVPGADVGTAGGDTGGELWQPSTMKMRTRKKMTSTWSTSRNRSNKTRGAAEVNFAAPHYL